MNDTMMMTSAAVFLWLYLDSLWVEAWCTLHGVKRIRSPSDEGGRHKRSLASIQP